MRVLFVCNQNKHRSRTAEEVFKEFFETKSAGLYNEKPVSESELSWADTIAVMEEEQRIELAKRFPQVVMQKRIVSLGIPDVFRFNQPELIDALKSKVNELLS